MNAQTKLDSLYTVWENKTQKDSIRANAYFKYIWDGVLFKKPDSALILAKELLVFANDKQLLKAKAKAYKLQGVSFYVQGNYPKALDFFKQSLKIGEEIGDKKGIAASLSNIGSIYQYQSDFTQALDYYQRGLKIAEELEIK
jgi:adenylate cyclase